jgi:hypothetical protein
MMSYFLGVQLLVVLFAVPVVSIQTPTSDGNSDILLTKGSSALRVLCDTKEIIEIAYPNNEVNLYTDFEVLLT